MNYPRFLIYFLLLIFMEQVVLGKCVSLTEISVDGHIELGNSGDLRTRLIAGREACSVPSVVSNLYGDNLALSEFAHYVYKLAAKTKLANNFLPMGSIPTMVLKKIKGYFSVADVKIGEHYYRRGISLESDFIFFNHKGKLDFHIDLDEKNLNMSGFGHLSSINIKSRGKTFFALRGIGSRQYKRSDVGTVYTIPQDALAMQFSIDPLHQGKSFFEVDGMLAIPALALEKEIGLKFGKDRLCGKTIYRVGNLFSVDLSIHIDPAKPQNFKAEFSFESGFEKILSDKIIELYQGKGLLINLKEAKGSVSGAALMAGKTAIIESLSVGITLPGIPMRILNLRDIPFDFTAVKESVSHIAKLLAKQINNMGLIN